MKKILMILTSSSEMLATDKKTGLWIGEFTDPYYEFKDHNFIVILASPKGGEVPIDPLSELTENITASNRRFLKDDFAQHALKHTLKLEDIDSNDYDALFYPGGHGPLFDLAINSISGQLIVDFLSQDKPVGAVCHGPAALVAAAQIEPSILIDKRVTGFSNAEEKLVFRWDNIPFSIEDKLTELGADFDSALIPFASHTEKDGLLVTGQNPMSALPVAKELVELLT